MISTNRLLVCLVGLVVLGSAWRLFSLARYHRSVVLHVTDVSQPSDLRQTLFLDPDHRIDHFVAVPDVARPSDEIRPPSCKVAWITIHYELGDRAVESVRGTAILRNHSDDPYAVDITSLLPQSGAEAIATLTAQWLEELQFPTVASLPSRALGQTEITVGVWDPVAPVYVTAGPDAAPGIAGNDDDGSGMVDDLGELGATGSDDFVVAPGQPGYDSAENGSILSRLISRGAIMAANPDQPLVVTGETEIWLDFDRSDSARHRQIMLRLR